MTSNDVHGGTIKTGVFADTCIAFTIMLHNGEEITIHEDDPAEKGFRPIQFARVNLGLLGIVTQIQVKCNFRPKKESLQGQISFINTTIEEEFVSAFKDFVTHERLETFYDPYTGGFMPLMWDLTNEFNQVGTPNDPLPPKLNTEQHALQNFYGSPLQGIFFKKGGPFDFIEKLVETTGTAAQYLGSHSSIVGRRAAEFWVKEAMKNISTSQITSAFTAYSEAWLQDAARCIFMSYFVELPNLDEEGLSLTYELLNVVTDIVTKKDHFHISAPMEFRFVKAGDTVMAGTYNSDRSKVYVNLDLIAFVKPSRKAKDPKNYPVKLLEFMASVERKWFGEYGGLPHQGKMYGFYDPNSTGGKYSVPFNDNFIQKVNERRDEIAPGGREAFDNYRMKLDPKNMFLNKYTEKLLM